MELIDGKTCTGSYYGGWKSKDSIPKLIQDYLDKKIMLDELISGELPLDRIVEAFDLLAAGKTYAYNKFQQSLNCNIAACD